jgi:outer membrane protein TolC
MRSVFGWLLVVLTVAPGLAARDVAAQPPAAIKAVTFDDAVQRALERSPTVVQAATTIARAEAILQQTRSLTRPQVNARVDSVTLDTETAFESAVIQPRHQLTLGGTLSVPLVALARRSTSNQARDQLEVATLSTADIRRQIAVATAQAYLAVINAQRQVEVEMRALENARAHLDYADRRFQGGVGSRLNMVRAAQAAAGEESRSENAQLVLRQTQEALGVLIAEDGPVDATGEPAFDVPSTVSETEWMAARPDLVVQAARIRAAERVMRDSWKEVSPFAEASFDPQYVTPAGIFQPARTWRLTISVTQPIFQGGLQQAVRREREILFDSSRIALTDLEIRARSEVRLAQASLASLERILGSARNAAEQAGEVLRITTTAFEVGATTNIEVIDAQRSARDADTAVALAEDAVQRARLDLLVAIGRFPK